MDYHVFKKPKIKNGKFSCCGCTGFRNVFIRAEGLIPRRLRRNEGY